MRRQIVVIHGGSTFDTYDEYLKYLKDYKLDFDKLKIKGWKQTLEERLGNGFEVISPRMPNKANAKYTEWEIWFEKFIPYLENPVALVGQSLGGIFLAKYLSENKFPKKILATFLISAPYDGKDSKYSLSSFALPENLDKFIEQGGKIHVYHSKDDPIVPFADFEKYKKALPEAETHVFDDRGHFNQEEFPELVNDIKNVYN